MRFFRLFEHGYRMVGEILCKSGMRLEEFKGGLWVYVDTMPDLASAKSFVTNCGGTIHEQVS